MNDETTTPQLTMHAELDTLTVEELIAAALTAKTNLELLAVHRAAEQSGVHLTPVTCTRHQLLLPLQALILGHILAHDRTRRPTRSEAAAGLKNIGRHQADDFRVVDESKNPELYARERMRAGIAAMYQGQRERAGRRRRVGRVA